MASGVSVIASPLLQPDGVSPSAEADTSAPDCGCRRSWQWERVADARLFTHSRFVSPRVLLAFRCVYFVWQLCACIALGVKDWGPNRDGLVVMVTLSYLSFCSIVCYFGVTVAFTLRHPMLYKPPAQFADDSADPSAVRVGTGLRLLWVVFEVLCADSLVVTSVFWAVLHSGHGLSWQDFHMHTLNAIGMLCELALNSLPVAGAHVAFMLAFGVLYLCWSLAVHAVASSHAFIYPFLDYTKHWWSAFQYPAVLLYAVALFYVAVGLYRVREALARRFAGADAPTAPGNTNHLLAVPAAADPHATPMHRMSVDHPRLTDDTGLTDAAALRAINSRSGSVSRSSHPALLGDNAL